MRNPVKMEDLLRDLFGLAGFSCRGPICLKAFTTHNGITSEAIVHTFQEFCRNYHIISSYTIELDNPTLPSSFGESFEMNKLVITLRLLGDDWNVRLHTEDEEIPHSFMENLKDKLKGRKDRILKLALSLWKLLESFQALSGQSPASSS